MLKDYGVGSPQNFSAFASFGFHPVAAGVPWFPAGALIGIPANFNSTADDPGGITNRSIFINGETVDWTSEAGSALKDSLLFSEDSQKFAIARDVARLQCGGPVLNAAVAPLCLGGVWIYSAMLKQMFGLHGGPLILRGAANGLSLCLGSASYIISMEAVSNWIDRVSDRRAAQVSQGYAKGGLEFYDKILSRNKTLRSLMGEKGKEVYAPSGNLFPGYVFQFRHTPYTSRRKGILDLLNEEKSWKAGGQLCSEI